MEIKLQSFCKCLVYGVAFLLSSVKASAQHWSFEGKNPLNAKQGFEKLELKNVRSQIELTPGIIGSGIRTDGYSTFLRKEIKPGQKVFTCSGWFALESFPTDTGAFFAMRSVGDAQSISINVNRFGEILIGIGKHSNFSYLNTGLIVEKFKWLHVAMSLNSGVPGIWMNGKKLQLDLPFIGAKWEPRELLIGKDFKERLLGKMDLTLINGIIDEVKLGHERISIHQFQAETTRLAKKVPILAIPPTRFENDFSRPKYHLMPAANWTNETHGLIYYKGLYHIFNQKNASNLALRQINWGHFSSRDMVNWTEHKPAISPEKGYDENGIWSGHVIIDDQGMPIISYTAGGEKMGIALAFPKDSTLTEWTKYKGNPVIPRQPEGYSRADLRDTYVWKDGDKWYMVVGFGIKKDTIEKGALLLYKSSDLKQWDFLHTLFEGSPDQDNSGIFWEMPVFKKMGDKYILLVNKVPHKGVPARALYWTGEFVNERFIPDYPLPKNLEVINRLLSPSVADDQDGRVSAIAIIPDEISGEAAWQQGWNHLYSIPRVWSLVNGVLKQSPHPAMEKLRAVKREFTNVSVSGSKSYRISDGLQQYEVKATIQPGDARKFGFILHKNPDKSEYTSIYYDVEEKEIVVDQTHSSLRKGIPLRTRKDHFVLDLTKPTTFHLFVDGSVVEVFINNESAFTTRIFPSTERSNLLEIFAEGGTVQVEGEFWKLNSAPINTDF